MTNFMLEKVESAELKFVAKAIGFHPHFLFLEVLELITFILLISIVNRELIVINRKESD